MSDSSVERAGQLQFLGRVKAADAPVAGGDGSGGDGVVTAFKDGLGRVLTDVHVILIFWGKEWTQNPALPLGTVDQAIQGILASAYLARLAQYRNIGPATFVKTDLNADNQPNTQFSNDEVAGMIQQRIALGKVPAPSSLPDPFYCVIMPTGVSSKDHADDVGYHYSFDSNGTKAYCAWVTNDGSITDNNSITKVFSHELAEACSDPDGGLALPSPAPEVVRLEMSVTILFNLSMASQFKLTGLSATAFACCRDTL